MIPPAFLRIGATPRRSGEILVQEVDTVGIRRETARPTPVGNASDTLGRCPALVRIFCDKNIPEPAKTEGVAIGREVPMGFKPVRPGITDQPGSKDLSDRAGRGLSQVRSLGKGFCAQANGTCAKKGCEPKHVLHCLLHDKSP